MTCRFCRQRTDFIDAHVIPAGIFRRLDDEGSVPRLLAGNEREYPKRSPTGIYDPTILCAGCEPTFGPWDHYAQEILTPTPLGTPQIERGQLAGFELDQSRWDYETLKLFFLSLAWRASVSTHRFYSDISLGPFEDRVRTMLIDGDPGNSQEHSVLLATFTDSLGKTLLNPDTRRLDGIKHLTFYLAGYVAYINVDKRATPAWVASFALAPQSPLKVIHRDFVQSKERILARAIVQQQQNALRSRARHRIIGLASR